MLNISYAVPTTSTMSQLPRRDQAQFLPQSPPLARKHHSKPATLPQQMYDTHQLHWTRALSQSRDQPPRQARARWLPQSPSGSHGHLKRIAFLSQRPSAATMAAMSQLTPYPPLQSTLTMFSMFVRLACTARPSPSPPLAIMVAKTSLQAFLKVTILRRSGVTSALRLLRSL